MRAYDSLRRRSDFSRLYRRGKRFASASFLLYVTRISQPRRPLRLGIAVSKAVGKAVRRNLVRRRVQGVFDGCEAARYEGCEMIVVAKPGAAELAFSVLAAQLHALIRQAGAVS